MFKRARAPKLDAPEHITNNSISSDIIIVDDKENYNTGNTNNHNNNNYSPRSTTGPIASPSSKSRTPNGFLAASSLNTVFDKEEDNETNGKNIGLVNLQGNGNGNGNVKHMLHPGFTHLHQPSNSISQTTSVSNSFINAAIHGHGHVPMASASGVDLSQQLRGVGSVGTSAHGRHSPNNYNAIMYDPRQQVTPQGVQALSLDMRMARMEAEIETENENEHENENENEREHTETDHTTDDEKSFRSQVTPRAGAINYTPGTDPVPSIYHNRRSVTTTVATTTATTMIHEQHGHIPRIGSGNNSCGFQMQVGSDIVESDIEALDPIDLNTHSITATASVTGINYNNNNNNKNEKDNNKKKNNKAITASRFAFNMYAMNNHGQGGDSIYSMSPHTVSSPSAGDINSSDIFNSKKNNNEKKNNVNASQDNNKAVIKFKTGKQKVVRFKNKELPPLPIKNDINGNVNLNEKLSVEKKTDISKSDDESSLTSINGDEKLEENDVVEFNEDVNSPETVDDNDGNDNNVKPKWSNYKRKRTLTVHQKSTAKQLITKLFILLGANVTITLFGLLCLAPDLLYIASTLDMLVSNICLWLAYSFNEKYYRCMCKACIFCCKKKPRCTDCTHSSRY